MTRKATVSKTIKPSKVVKHVGYHKLAHAAVISKPSKVAHNPKHKVGKLGAAHGHKPLVIWFKGHFFKRIYYTVLVGGVATWYFYDDGLPDGDAYASTLATVPTCGDADSDDCEVRPVPVRARAVPGARAGCQVAVYDGKDFDGASWVTGADQPALDDKWSNKIVSIQVIAGTWDFYLDPQYQSEVLTLENGTYPDVGDDWSQRINSFKCTPAR